MRVRSGGCSTSRASAENKDCWGADPNGSFFVLASGFGAQPQTISRTICEHILRTLIPTRENLDKLSAESHPDSRQLLLNTLCDAIISAENELTALNPSSAKEKNMATCDLVYLANGMAYVAHIGNNRVYLLRGDSGRQLTIDHTAYEQLRRQGKEERDCAPHIYKSRLTHALGMGGTPFIDTLQIDLKQGDRLIVCSENAHASFKNETHLSQLYRSRDPQHAADFLINYAMDTTGCQEVSVICIEISDPGARKTSLETDSRITALGQICFFKNLSYQEMLQIMPITFERNFEPNTTIIREGDVGDELYILVDGKCDVSNHGVKLATLEPGCSFGELSLVDRQPRSATVTAMEHTRVLVIRANDFEKLTSSGQLAIKLLWNVSHELSERLRKSSETIRKQGAKLLSQNT